MTNKTIIAGLVALAFVTGSMMMGTMAYADHKPSHQSNAGGVPDLQSQVDENSASIDSFFDIFVDLGELDAEAAARQAADENLQFQIDSFFDVFTEISVHDADIAELDGHVTVLKGQSEAGDTELQRQIDSFFDVWTEIEVHDADIDAIDTEIVALSLRSDQGDAGLQFQIDSFFDVFTEIEVHDADIDAIDTEIVALSLRSESGDTELQRQIDSFFDVFIDVGELNAEAEARAAADAALADALDAEAATRAAEDNALQSALDAEDAARQAADAALADALDAEAADRQAADASLAADLQAEIDAHAAADGDTSSSNEIQSLSITGQSLSISGANTVILPPAAPHPQLGGTRDIQGSPGATNIECLIGEVKLFAGGFAPSGFVAAEGQLLPIAQNTALFSIFGITFGGDGITNFGLPDLRAVEPNSAGGGQNDDINYIVCTNGIFPSRD